MPYIPFAARRIHAACATSAQPTIEFPRSMTQVQCMDHREVNLKGQAWHFFSTYSGRTTNCNAREKVFWKAFDPTCIIITNLSTALDTNQHGRWNRSLSLSFSPLWLKSWILRYGYQYSKFIDFSKWHPNPTWTWVVIQANLHAMSRDVREVMERHVSIMRGYGLSYRSRGPSAHSDFHESSSTYRIEPWVFSAFCWM